MVNYVVLLRYEMWAYWCESFAWSNLLLNLSFLSKTLYFHCRYDKYNDMALFKLKLGLWKYYNELELYLFLTNNLFLQKIYTIILNKDIVNDIACVALVYSWSTCCLRLASLLTRPSCEISYLVYLLLKD